MKTDDFVLKPHLYKQISVTNKRYIRVCETLMPSQGGFGHRG